MTHADHAALKASGRNFICSECPERTKNLRRCQEERENFGPEDGIIFPIQISQGGERYGFCPGKATWNPEYTKIFQLMSLAAESGDYHYVEGGIVDQPSWWIENVSWFIQTYKQLQFTGRAKSILGDGTALKGVKAHGGNRKPTS